MAVAPFQIIASPASLYIANASTAEPVITDTTLTGWTSLGQTEGGTSVKHTQKVDPLMTDQAVRPVKFIRSEEGMEITVKLAELTLENYRYALNSNAVTVTTGPPHTKSVNISKGVVVQTHALLVRGPSPYGNWNLQFWVPIVVMSSEPEVAFVKDDKAVLEMTFTAGNDSSQTVGLEFGRVLAQDA